MKRDLKIVVLLILLTSSTSFAENNNTQNSDSKEEYIMKAPLQSELSEVYKGSKKVGKKAGKSTKNFFCSELHWEFFCTGEE